jgi:hypothetical protein
MQRIADFFEARVTDPPLQGAPSMAHLMMTRGPGDLTAGRPQLATWQSRMSELPSVRATAPR